MHPVERYLKDLSEIRSTGGAVAETSYYGAIEHLLNEVGKKEKPKVRCVLTVANTGAGSPDMGLYTANQFQRTKDADPVKGTLPERGVVEIKGTGDDSWVTAKGKQVTKYWGHYGQILVTNYRDFVFVGRDEDGKPIKLETLRLAESEKAFWDSAAHPRRYAAEIGDRLVDFLRRVILHPAPLTDPEAVAWFLASYAREARARIEEAADLPALAGLRSALEESLGLKFEGNKGEHFFQATLVQTLFYGIFSSWVLWVRQNPGKRFNWHEAIWTLHVPMIATLFSQIATPRKLKPLRVDEVLDWTGMVLNRVEQKEFFKRFEEEHAVQYFYEPFLKAYDPQLRKELGVWYTPPEIVKYQVERIDRVLREELDITDGLADDNVVVLDPCCGTGAYLVETLRRIHRTLKDKGGDALVAQRLKKAAMERVFGFEILPAPFVVSHLQLGLMLRHLGAPLKEDSDERVGVYLTNALTGWEPLKKPKDELPLFPELEQEREAAERVKRKAPILVILGNPPYNAFAGTSPDEEGGLVEPYKGVYEAVTQTKKGKEKKKRRYKLNDPVSEGGWGIKKFNLDDLYVRFFRIAERRIVKSGKGVVSYISNFSYLDDPSFVIMRERFLAEFDKLWFDCMNGDSRKTGKRTPQGEPDPSVFSTEQNRVGIRKGTTICLMVRKEKRQKKPIVRFQDYWGGTKRRDLLGSLSLKRLERKYNKSKPGKVNRYSFRPSEVDHHYLEWPKVAALCAEAPSNGLMEKRGGALIDIDRDALESRMRVYYDGNVDWTSLVARGITLCKDAARYKAQETRKKVLAVEAFNDARMRRYTVRPFDSRWCYYSSVRPLWNEPRPSYSAQCWEGNSCIVARPAGVAHPEGSPLFHASVLGDNDFQRGHAYYFPLRLRRKPQDRNTAENQNDLFASTVTANLSETARTYLASLGIKNTDKDAETAGLIWMHALAIGYSPAYLSENADGLRQDWPRIPLPDSRKTLLASAKLGRLVATLLDTENDVTAVTTGSIRRELRHIAVISRVGGGSLDPTAGHLDVTAGWGYAGQNGACMPGAGKAVDRKTKPREAPSIFGAGALDVYLNDTAFWANVPRAVWDYTIGGYQIVKKWLSYREKVMLGRSLKLDEVEYVTQMCRRIAALILLQEKLDANYNAIRSNTYPWPSGSPTAE